MKIDEIESSSFKNRDQIKENDYLDRLDLELIKLIEKLNNQKQCSMPKTSEEAELDELLSDMLVELQSSDNQSKNSNKSSIENKENQEQITTTKGEQMLAETNQSKICGGGRSNLSNDEQALIASPRFLKKPSYDAGSSGNLSSSAPIAQIPFTYGIETTSPALQRRRLHSEKTAYVSESDQNQQQQTNRSSSVDRRSEENLIELLRQEANEDARSNRQMSTNSSLVSDGSVIAGQEDLDWLERQKLKLRSRRDGEQWRDRFNKERNLMQELRTAVKPKQQEYDQPLHIDTNQSINIPINRQSNSQSNQRIYQRSQSANVNQQNREEPEFRTVHTKKKTLQRNLSGGDNEQTIAPIIVRTTPPLRNQSPSSSISNQQSRRELVHATNLPIKEEIIEEIKPKQSIYGTVSRTPVIVHNIKVERPNPPLKQTVDETDLNELIRTASSPVYAYSRPTSRQSTVANSTIDHQNHQPIYKAQSNQVFVGYNQSTPIRVGLIKYS